MSEPEAVDIVDENNRVLSQTDKSEAHAKGLLHRTILAEIKNAKGEWLLVKQAGDRQDAGQYVSPIGGHIKAGESEVDALKREAFEEVGITGFANIYKGRQIWNRFVRHAGLPTGRQENHFFFLYEITWNGEIKLNEESVEFRWFPLAELVKLTHNKSVELGDAWYFAAKTFYPEIFNQS
jgi:8-oxo-dGTP pyrophosphatase MutT (NUDIX family)